MNTHFLAAVSSHSEGLSHISSGVCADCAECQSLYGMGKQELAAAIESGRLADDPHIGRHCDTCGVTCQQQLYDGHALADGQLVHLSLCADCVCWFANGDVPSRWEGARHVP